MRKFRPHHLALAAILLVALLFRVWALGARPMHADEANQAVKLGELLEQGTYWFDPADHHGPTLYYFARPVAWLFGQFTLAELTETVVRLTPALFGTLIVLLTALLAAPLGRVSFLVAPAFVAVAPAAVYYSRYFIQETLLLAFTLGALLCGREWLRSGRVWWALAMGACAGLMFATKALAPLFAVAALVSLAVEHGLRAPPPRRLRGFAWACLALLVTGAVLYSSFGDNPDGVQDALASFVSMFDRATGGASGHEKPWWYYAELLTRRYDMWPDWRPLPFLALATVGYFSSWRSSQPLMRFLVVYTTIIAAVLSFTPYKTPWVVIHLVPPLALFAAEVYELPLRWRRIAPVPLFAIAAISVALLGWSAWFVAFKRPADPRNPFAYVHAAPDVLKVRPLAESVRRDFPADNILVIGSDYWPLPWYLRGLPRVGYYPVPPETIDAPLVFVTADLASTVQERLTGDYTMSYLGLRPNVILVAFARSGGSDPQAASDPSGKASTAPTSDVSSQ